MVTACAVSPLLPRVLVLVLVLAQALVLLLAQALVLLLVPVLVLVLALVLVPVLVPCRGFPVCMPEPSVSTNH